MSPAWAAKVIQRRSDGGMKNAFQRPAKGGVSKYLPPQITPIGSAIAAEGFGTEGGADGIARRQVAGEQIVRGRISIEEPMRADSGAAPERRSICRSQYRR